MIFRVPDTIPRTAAIHGDAQPAGAIAALLTEYGFAIHGPDGPGPVGVLINTVPANGIHQRIQAFADALPPPHQGVAINLLGQGVWSLTPHAIPDAMERAALWRLTQTMALALAPRIRVCAIGSGPVLGGGPLPREPDPRQIARAVLAILAFPSMTGQMIVPDGAPPDRHA